MRTEIIIIALTVVMASCSSASKRSEADHNTLTVFHAGSLSVPLKVLADSFAAQHRDVRFRMEAAGSLETIRKITELGKQADIVASADCRLIDEMLIPDRAGWSLPFAGNEMVIVYGNHSKMRQEISSSNWHSVMQSGNLAIGRSNPDLDPCGYRTVLLLKLAEKYYGQPGLADHVLKASQLNIRPKETDLIALLQTGHLDYIFIYRSIAVQHGLDYLVLPDEINLSNPDFEPFYAQVSTSVKGRKPGEQITITGEAITYGITVLSDAPNKVMAERFIAFMMSSTGKNILLNLGHRTLESGHLPIETRLPDIILEQMMENEQQ